MMDLLRRLLAIVLLRSGPQDLPAGTGPLAVALALYMAVATLSTLVSIDPPERPLLTLVLFLVLPLVMIQVVLTLAGRRARFEQTATALFGTGAVLSMLNLPLAALEPEAVPPPLAVAALAVFFWHFVVDAHIWRHALEVTFTAGLAVAVILFAVSFFVIFNLGGMG